MTIKSVKDLQGQLQGKRVLVRVGYDVPFDDKGNITDDSRIRATLPTIDFLREEGARIILLSHLGRPKGIDPSLSLRPVAKALHTIRSDYKIEFVPFCKGKGMETILGQMKDTNILMLDNVRFEKGEEQGPEYDAFCEEMSLLFQVYINEAFSVSHRSSASMVGIPKRMKEKGKDICVGLQTLKEIEMLTPLLKPRGYSVAVIGGAKVKDKIRTIKKFLDIFSKVLIGGGMANTFLAAAGKSVGKSKVENEFLEELRPLLANPKLMTPLDGMKGKLIDDNMIVHAKAVGVVDFSSEAPKEDEYVLDIGRRTIAYFREELKKADTIFWNGPMGVFENPAFFEGTKEVAEVMAQSRALTVVGGGDTVLATDRVGVTKKMKWVSTGGGASQEFIENNGSLPAIDILR